MSAVNILNQGDRVSIAADGGIYASADSRLLAIASKIEVLPTIHAALAMRGVYGLSPALGERFTALGTFDRALAAAPRLIHAAMDSFTKQNPGAPAQCLGCKASLIGWSQERGALVAYRLDTTTGGALEPVPYLSAGPSVGDDLATAAAGAEIACEADWFAADSGAAALALLEAQRAMPVYDEALGVAGAHIVGGFAEIVTITRDAIERRILRRWPDMIGETIDPRRI